MPPRKSLQDLIRQRQRSTFVGREMQLELFRETVRNPRVELDGTRYFDHLIFNIWGQGGVGKSTLMGQFQQIAQSAGFVRVSMDEGIKALPEMLGRFAEQLAQQELPLPKFAERYKTYREKREEVETDPEAPQGFAAFLGRTVTRTGLRLAKKVPLGGDALAELVDDKALVDQGGEWAAYLSRKLKNKDEVILLRESERVLTQLFLKDLEAVAAKRDVLLCFDTYEETERFLDDWLRALLTKDQYGVVPTNVVLVVAGRTELERNDWAALGDVIVRLPLEPFTEEEAQGFLARKGIVDERVVEVILEISGRLPLLMATLAEESPGDVGSVGDASGTAVERFLKWVDDPVQRQLALDGALPRKIDRDIVAILVGEDLADESFGWLITRPFVKERSDGWVYHEVVRTQMLRYKRRVSQEQWKAQHKLLAENFQNRCESLDVSEGQLTQHEGWQEFRLGWLYHFMCSKGSQQPLIILQNFPVTLNWQNGFVERITNTVSDAEKSFFGKIKSKWVLQLSRGFKFYQEAKYSELIPLISNILDSMQLDENWRYHAIAFRGFLLRMTGKYEDSLRDLNQSISVSSNNKWSLSQRGKLFEQCAAIKMPLLTSNVPSKLIQRMHGRSPHAAKLTN